MNDKNKRINPIIKCDYPDPDVIRVGDTYYMISTTMYFMPGGVILRSYNLRDWEICSYVFDCITGSDAECLRNGKSAYGQGMWAATLRFHEGKFYVAFVSHKQENTHLYTAENIEGPWKHTTVSGYYHDLSLLFDDDGRIFIVSGNTDIRLVELDENLTGPKPGGIDKVIVRDNRDEVILGYEGAHFYKINGKYVLTLIHWPKYNGRRTEAVFVSDRIDGTYEGRDVMWDDEGFRNSGSAQGGLVDTPEGRWFSIVFRDSGAVGRIPVLIPVCFEEGYPIFGKEGKIPGDFYIEDNRPGYKYEPLYKSGFGGLQWQWNHVPDMKLVKLSEDCLEVTTDETVVNLTYARNILTQRTMFPACEAEVTVDGRHLQNGDFAGLCMLQSGYGFVGIHKRNDSLFLTVMKRDIKEVSYEIGKRDNEPGEIIYEVPLEGDCANVMLRANFGEDDDSDTVDFFVRSRKGERIHVAEPHRLMFRLDHFTGARFGLCIFSTERAGGTASWHDFKYCIL
ncbi:MAG: glycoside hydrolase 43 family protein [Clostridia bacterium]|nr:glycoside hydrolase 43 family protein [Clostridia bacterium]